MQDLFFICYHCVEIMVRNCGRNNFRFTAKNVRD